MCDQPKTKLVQKSELKRMCPQQKARCLAYAEPSKLVQAGIAAAHRRVAARQSQEKKTKAIKAPDSKLQLNELLCQLQAAEARNRIWQRRERYENLKARRFDHI